MKHFALLMLVTLVAAPAAGQDAADRPIQFGEIENTFARGVAEERVTVVYFTADWCAVCRKMERVVYADPGVRAAATPFAWAKVDIDDQPELSAMFGVRGVPHFALLNVHGELLYERSGALNVSSMLELLGDYPDKANDPGAVRGRITQLGELTERVGEMGGGGAAEATDVLELVALLAEPNPVGAEETTERLIGMGPTVWPGLVSAMGHDRLAIRAAAYDLLLRSSGQDLPFDPFLKAEQREPMRDAWRAWVDEQAIEARDQPAPEHEAGDAQPEEAPPKEPQPAAQAAPAPAEPSAPQAPGD